MKKPPAQKVTEGSRLKGSFRCRLARTDGIARDVPKQTTKLGEVNASDPRPVLPDGDPT